MGLGNIGFTELIVVLAIILVLFGAKRIPEIAGSFGKGIKEFKKNMNDVHREITAPGREARTEQLNAVDPLHTRQIVRDEERPEPKRLL